MSPQEPTENRPVVIMKARHARLVVFLSTLLLSLLITGFTFSYLRDGERRRGNELIQAAWDGDVNRMKELIDAGDDVNFNKTANPSCIPLTCAAKQGHLEAAQILIDSNADIEMTDDSHMTALMWAAENGHTDVVRLLLSKGADVNATHYGETALNLAKGKGRTDIVDLLKQAGAKR